MLDDTITALKGIGQVRAAAFERLGITRVRELLYHFPRDYRDFSVSTPVNRLVPGALCAVRLTVTTQPKQFYPVGGMRIVSASAQDETGLVKLVWFNQPYRMDQIKPGMQRVFCGRVDAASGMRIVNAQIMDALPGIVPVYPLVSGIKQKQVRDAVRSAIALMGDIEDVFDAAFQERYGLMGLSQALCEIHAPTAMETLREAKKRLSFEDMLCYLLAIYLLKAERCDKRGIAFDTLSAAKGFLLALPFKPTGAQARVMDEIAKDMSEPRPMNRLIQGDVGAGKTILAFFAMHIAGKNAYQSALMAPTELLARQHYALLERMYGDEALLLYGGMRKRERDGAYARIADGSARYIVGTHALLQPSLQFHRLGLVIADEQHRFGVRQRACIASKAQLNADVLIMSATPIPRTLAMLLYGDLDMSVVDELPPGRRPVITRLVPKAKRLDMYRFIWEQTKSGMQAYVVCPLVEQSELMQAKSAQEVYDELKALLPEAATGLLHGRMPSKDKEETLTAFREGRIDILVSTTVVEVGVDVPGACIMVIENADRFGLAQLHQLRGRVGRGAKQSFCFLLCVSGGDAVMERINIMTRTNDGFEIAKTDLELRGPGEFLGARQHGEDELQAVRVAAGMDVLLMSKRAADSIIDEGETAGNAPILRRARALYESRMREIANN